jgi:membrane-associated phospholipid phosphatase
MTGSVLLVDGDASVPAVSLRVPPGVFGAVLLMSDVLQLLVGLDHDAIRATAELRWSPATTVLALISMWWVKGPLLVAAGWCADLRNGRVFPMVAFAATLSFALASGLNAVVKQVVGRSRPPGEIGLEAVVGVPSSPSFPSGHAMTAFAVAATIALLAPRLRWAVLALAGVIAVSRVYLGVHFWFDVLAGAAFGMAIGALIAVAVRRSAAMRPS